MAVPGEVLSSVVWEYVLTDHMLYDMNHPFKYIACKYSDEWGGYFVLTPSRREFRLYVAQLFPTA